MKNKSIAQYSLTVSSELTADEVLNDFDPLLLKKINLVVSNHTGRQADFFVDYIELVSVEDLEDE